MNATVFANISLCTGVLGLFMVAPLLALARKRPASVWLALYLLGISHGALGDYLRIVAPHDWMPARLWSNLAAGPLFYAYVRGIIGLGMGWRQLVHFVPLALYLAVLLVTGAAGNHSALVTSWDHSYWSIVFTQVQSAFYIVAVLYRLRQHRQRVRANYSSTGDRDLRWLTTVSYVLIVFWAGWVMGGAHPSWLAWYALERLAVFYFFGWYGMRQVEVFIPAMDAPQPEALDSGPVSPGEREKYARSGMTSAAQQLIGERLERRMKRERDYLESDLRLTELAERIGTTPQLLSQYLNRVLGLSFFDYINGLRIVEVQNLMRDPAHAGSTLLELAHAAGFNSKSTFNIAFKEIAGMAPSRWRALHAQGGLAPANRMA